MKRSLHLVCAIALLCSAALAEEHTEESLESVKAKVEDKKAVLLDVRDKQEWDEGHVDGATFLPLGELRRRDQTESMLKSLPKDQVYYTYCVLGVRSRKAAEILKKNGYEVHALKPCYNELIEAGFPDAKSK